MVPRSRTLNRDDAAYNKVLRLEGQISAAISLISFRSWSSSLPSHPLAPAIREYILGIRFLIDRFLGHNFDLVNYPGNLGGLVNMVLRYNFGYFDGTHSLIERFAEHPLHWPRILWFQELQMVLEDETKDIGRALMAGWKMYIREDGYPAMADANVREYSQIWKAMSGEEQADFVDKTLNVSAVKIREWNAELQRGEFPLATADAKTAAFALLNEAAIVCPPLIREVYKPRLKDKPEKEEISDCPVCMRPLLENEVDTEAEHRPVKTKCGHVFGHACIQEWFTRRKDNCPMCRKDLFYEPLNEVAPKDILETVDKELLWTDRPPHPTVHRAPHSHLDRLAIIFGPANEVRRKLLEQHTDPGDAQEELMMYAYCAVFLARDRLQAALDGTEELLREVVPLQAQVAARIIFHEFMRSWHPDFDDWTDDDDNDSDMNSEDTEPRLFIAGGQ